MSPRGVAVLGQASPRSVVSVNGATKEEELVVDMTEACKGVQCEAYACRIERLNSLPQLTQPSAVIHVKDDKPAASDSAVNFREPGANVVPGIELTPRGGEGGHPSLDIGAAKESTTIYERRALTKEEQQRDTKRRVLDDQRSQQVPTFLGQWRSHLCLVMDSSGGHAARRTRGRLAFGNGIAHARYGSLSDSPRRGELKYVPNGEVRESHYHVTAVAAATGAQELLYARRLRTSAALL
ncbi:unnamed protein product, partial [Mesorhabditis spiculigera]